MRLVESDIFFSGVFSESAVLRTGEGNFEIRGIFDVENDPILESEGRRITFTVTSDILDGQSIRHGDTIRRNGTVYTIIGVEPLDDGSYVDLVLRK